VTREKTRASVATLGKMSGLLALFSVVAAPGKEYKDYVRAAPAFPQTGRPTGRTALFAIRPRLEWGEAG
jgi:hypothetical protein